MNFRLPIFLAILCTASLSAMEMEKTQLHIVAADCDRTSDVYAIISRSTNDIASQDGDGNTPLHEAAYFGCLQNADLLLKHGADVNKQNFRNETPLDKAHFNKHSALEKLLKEYGAQYSVYKHLNKPVSQKELDMALWNASAERNYYKMLYALKRGASPHVHVLRAGVYMTPLHVVAQTADYTTPYKVMQVLLDYGADINKEDAAGWTPYGRTSQSDDSQTGGYIAKFFSDRGARYKVGK